MNTAKLIWRNISRRPLSTALSLILLALGVGIIAMLAHTRTQMEQQLSRNVAGIDMVVGAKGSPLQLVLSAVFQLDAPTGNIPLSEAIVFQKHPMVSFALPLAYGDNYEGHRIVGTDTTYAAHYNTEVAAGRLWRQPFEVTLGASVAENTGLNVGDTFLGAHGLDAAGDAHDSHPYRVVGILTPSGTVADKLILTSLHSVWQIHGDEGVEQGKDITAMLVGFKTPMAMMQLPRMVNEKTTMMAALPAIEINRLFGLLETSVKMLNILAVIIMFISGVSVFISLYAALRERRFEIALMRTYGASRARIFWMIIFEGVSLAVIGAVAGLFVSRIGLWGISNFFSESYTQSLSLVEFLPADGYLILVSAGIGFMAAAIPAVKGFSANVHQVLSNG